MKKNIGWYMFMALDMAKHKQLFKASLVTVLSYWIIGSSPTTCNRSKLSSVVNVSYFGKKHLMNDVNVNYGYYEHYLSISMEAIP